MQCVEQQPWCGCTCRLQEAQTDSSWWGGFEKEAHCAMSGAAALAWLHLQADRSVRILTALLSSERQGIDQSSQPNASGCSLFPEQRAQH